MVCAKLHRCIPLQDQDRQRQLHQLGLAHPATLGIDLLDVPGTASGEKAFRTIQLGGEPEGKYLELADSARERMGDPCLVTFVACQQYSPVGIRLEAAEGAECCS